jgi:predicted nucleic acid-binding protein
MGPLVDTSVLVDYFRGVMNRATDLLDALLADGIAPATAPVIVQEFLKGFTRTRDVETATGHLSLFTRLEPPAYDTHERAAAAHRTSRVEAPGLHGADGRWADRADGVRCELCAPDPRRLSEAAGARHRRRPRLNWERIRTKG